jgi:hypothetical protein
MENFNQSVMVQVPAPGPQRYLVAPAHRGAWPRGSPRGCRPVPCHLNPRTGALLANLPQPEIGFNYLSPFSVSDDACPADWRPLTEDTGPDRRQSEDAAAACAVDQRRTAYKARHFTVAPAASGLFRYAPWLPVRREVYGSSRPVVFPSRGPGTNLGLGDLWIPFSGYWPERGCSIRSGTFKELEAYTVLGRVPDDGGVVVLASAGNTAAAFAASRSLGLPCVLVVPDPAVPIFMTMGDIPQHVNFVALEGATYNRAIDFSRGLVEFNPALFAEGGVRNVGRRDGLAVVMPAAYEEMGPLPDFYVQGVGSGAGAIAAFEATQCGPADFRPGGHGWNPSADIPLPERGVRSASRNLDERRSHRAVAGDTGRLCPGADLCQTAVHRSRRCPGHPDPHVRRCPCRGPVFGRVDRGDVRGIRRDRRRTRRGRCRGLPAQCRSRRTNPEGFQGPFRCDRRRTETYPRVARRAPPPPQRSMSTRRYRSRGRRTRDL